MVTPWSHPRTVCIRIICRPLHDVRASVVAGPGRTRQIGRDGDDLRPGGCGVHGEQVRAARPGGLDWGACAVAVGTVGGVIREPPEEDPCRTRPCRRASRRSSSSLTPPWSRPSAPDGTPHTAATWYDWEDGRFLLNMDDGRRRLDFMRRDPRVSLTILAEGTGTGTSRSKARSRSWSPTTGCATSTGSRGATWAALQRPRPHADDGLGCVTSWHGWDASHPHRE